MCLSLEKCEGFGRTVRSNPVFRKCHVTHPNPNATQNDDGRRRLLSSCSLHASSLSTMGRGTCRLSLEDFLRCVVAGIGQRHCYPSQQGSEKEWYRGTEDIFRGRHGYTDDTGGTSVSQVGSCSFG